MSSTRISGGRWLPAPGVIGAVLLWIGASLYGDTPDTHDTSVEIAAYFTSHRTSVLVGAVLVGGGLLCLLATVIRVGARLPAGRPNVARFAQSATIVGVGVLMTTVVVIDAGLAYIIGAEAPETAKGLFELTLVATPIASLAFAVAIGSIAVGLSRGSESESGVTISGLATVMLVVAAGSLAPSGAFSPDVQQPLMLLALATWMSVTDFRR